MCRNNAFYIVGLVRCDINIVWNESLKIKLNDSDLNENIEADNTDNTKKVV